jgi:hypothetical protein
MAEIMRVMLWRKKQDVEENDKKETSRNRAK